jgi:hypothetical protein
MSALLDTLLDAERRAECARHDAAGRPPADACAARDTATQRMEPVAGSARQWVRFPGIAWRNADAPRRRRADPPRASRFGDLTGDLA